MSQKSKESHSEVIKSGFRQLPYQEVDGSLALLSAFNTRHRAAPVQTRAQILDNDSERSKLDKSAGRCFFAPRLR